MQLKSLLGLYYKGTVYADSEEQWEGQYSAHIVPTIGSREVDAGALLLIPFIQPRIPAEPKGAWSTFSDPPISIHLTKQAQKFVS